MLYNSLFAEGGKSFGPQVASFDASLYIGSGMLYYPSSAGVDISDLVGVAADVWMIGGSGAVYSARFQQTNDGVHWYDVFSDGLATVANSHGTFFKSLYFGSELLKARWGINVTSGGPTPASGGCLIGASIFGRGGVSNFG